MNRMCFEFQVDVDQLDVYLARHREVWPEMLTELAAAGMRNYSIFHAGQGRMIGYYEAADLELTDRRLAASDVAKRWDVDMRPMFRDLADEPGTQVRHPIEVFNLEDQLGG